MSQILGSMRRLDEKRGAVRVEEVYDTVAQRSAGAGAVTWLNRATCGGWMGTWGRRVAP
jgi:hypothetical protein